MNVTVLFERLGPYHHARLQAAGKHFNLTAIEFSPKDNTYPWMPVSGSNGFKTVTLFCDAEAKKIGASQLRAALRHQLVKQDPRVIVIPGWGSRVALMALEWSRLARVPAVVMSATQAADKQRAWHTESVKSRVLKQFSAFVAGGQRQTDYLVGLGIERRKIFWGYNVVDNRHFSRGALVARNRGARSRVAFSIPGRYFLTACRFIKKKNLSRLIDAYAIYKKSAGDYAWHLVILGDGIMRPFLEKQVRRLELESHVHLPGFKQYDELPMYYGLASAYIQASTTEQWGLAVNEAMACGLPVFVSESCGCVPDLVREGVNGYAFNPWDVEGLARLMRVAASSPPHLERMGAASLGIIGGWTVDTFARSLAKAVETAMAAPPGRVSILDRAILKGLGYR